MNRNVLSAQLREQIALVRTKIKYQRGTFARKDLKRDPRAKWFAAYDFETTRIAVGTPAVKYLTAFGDDFVIDTRIKSRTHLRQVLITQFLIPELSGIAFVAWNGNRFDAFLIALTLVDAEGFTIRPYMNKSHQIRGIKVIEGDDPDSRTANSWEFLDGIAMTGLAGTTLEKFVANFAPHLPKLKEYINFDQGEEFDADNPKHCEYAFRDSEGLFVALTNAQRIMLENFDQPLGVTMGGACIRIFRRNIPSDVEMVSPQGDLREIFTRFLIRGGFCYSTRQFEGPVWKYDINQAYAAAMRESPMPDGAAMRVDGVPVTRIYAARITAQNPKGKVPFYYRTLNERGRSVAVTSATDILETWLTNVECEQLYREGWKIQFHESYCWPGKGFVMTDFVYKLERLRTTCDGGSKGPIGTMTKATGNHSFGKTLESLEPFEYLVAAEQPEGFEPVYDENNKLLPFTWGRLIENPRIKDYHQPQIGAWITAAVRMKLRRAILLCPEAWLYADTDCVVFDRDMTDKLDIDESRYGAWKIEESGTIYQFIAKKVYTEVRADGSAPDYKPSRSAKGMNVKDLTDDDFTNWLNGTAPEQDQRQLNNFLKVVQGSEMFRHQSRKGTRVKGIV